MNWQKKKSTIFPSILLLLMIAYGVMAVYGDPVPPDAPEVNFHDPTVVKKYFSIRLTKRGQGRFSTRLHTESEHFLALSCTGKGSDLRYDDMKSVEVKKWKGRKIRKGYFLCEPAKVKVVMKDNREQCLKSISSFLKLTTDAGLHFMYFYGKDKECEPLDGTVTMVEFPVKKRLYLFGK